MKLTPQQVEQFQQKGYLKIPHRVIADNHLDLLRERYDALFAKKRGTSGEGLHNLAVVGDRITHVRSKIYPGHASAKTRR